MVAGRDEARVRPELEFGAVRSRDLRRSNPDGSADAGHRRHSASLYPDWQPILRGYPRPKGAAPVTPRWSPPTSLRDPQPHPCAAARGRVLRPARRHSTQLTIGTPDANSAPASSIASIRLSVTPGTAGPPDDAEVGLHASITDVRNASDLSDHTGSLEARFGLRITDRSNTPYPGGPGPGTVTTSPTRSRSPARRPPTPHRLHLRTRDDRRRARPRHRDRGPPRDLADGRGRGARRVRPAVPAAGALRALRRAVLFGLLALLVWPAAAHASFPGQNGKIAFTRVGGCLYTANPDGSAESPVIPCDPSYFAPYIVHWSADGQWIAFEEEIGWLGYVRPDGSGYSNYNFDTGELANYALPPSGSEPGAGPVADASSHYENMGNSYNALEIQGPSARRLLTSSDESYTAPDWSPNGQEVAFASWVANERRIEAIGTDGQGRRTVVSSAQSIENTSPSWSPDGTKIAFVSNRDGNYEIYVVAADGTGLTRLTNNTLHRCISALVAGRHEASLRLDQKW